MLFTYEYIYVDVHVVNRCVDICRPTMLFTDVYV